MSRVAPLTIALLIVCLGGQTSATPLPAPATPTGRIAFIRNANLWLWEKGKERQLTDAKQAAAPQFSPSGRYIAFKREQELWVAEVDSGRQWRIAETHGAEWAPQQEILAYSTDAGTFTVAVTSSGPQEAKLVAATWHGPAWSPDGKHLAVTRGDSGAKPFSGTIYIGRVESGGGEPQVLHQETYPVEAACGQVGSAGDLRWSADGRWLSFYRYGLTASLQMDCNELLVLPASGGRPTSMGVMPSNPAWSTWAPTGATLAFIDGAGRDAWGNKALRVAPMPPTPPFPSLTPAGYADRDPAWSPEGRRLAFTRSLAEWPEKMTLPAPGQAIWIAERPQGPVKALPGTEHGFSPRWGPRGSLAWFRGVGGEKGSLWYVEAPGKQKERIIGEIDLPFPYYGQWNLEPVFDWWIPAKQEPTASLP